MPPPKKANLGPANTRRQWNAEARRVEYLARRGFVCLPPEQVAQLPEETRALLEKAATADRFLPEP